MSGRRARLFILCLIPFFLFMSAEEGAKPSALMDFIGKSVNFLLLFGTLAYLGAKPIKAFLERRSLDIKAELEEAEASRKTAEQKLVEIRERMKSLEAEAAGLKKAAEEEGRKSQALILEQARRETERIQSLAGQEIDLQVKAGIKEIRVHVADLAAGLAEDRLRRRLTPEAHKRLIDKSIERLDELYEKSNLG
jgi:F-type H+-transporting ATPase subunit b